MADPEPPGLGAASGELCRQFLNGLLVAGEHHGGGPVDRRDAHPVLQAGEQGEHLLLGGGDGDHGAARGQGLHERPACGDQRAGVGQRQDPGDVCGGDLTDRVSGDGVGPYAPGLHQTEQGHFDAEQGRLGHRCLFQLSGIAPQEHAVQGTSQTRVEFRARLVEGFCERGVGVVQFTPHAEALRALAGEQDGGPACRARALYEGAGGLAVREGSQPRQRGLAVPGHDHRAVLQVRPCGEGVRDVGGVGAVGPLQDGQQACGLGGQRF